MDDVDRTRARRDARETTQALQAAFGNEAVQVFLERILEAENMIPEAQAIYVDEALNAQGYHQGLPRLMWAFSSAGLTWHHATGAIAGVFLPFSSFSTWFYSIGLEASVSPAVIVAAWVSKKLGKQNKFLEHQSPLCVNTISGALCGYLFGHLLRFSSRATGSFTSKVFPHMKMISTMSLGVLLVWWLARQFPLLKGWITIAANKSVDWLHDLLVFELPQLFHSCKAVIAASRVVNAAESLLKVLVRLYLRKEKFENLKRFNYNKDAQFNPDREIRLLCIKRRIPFMELEAELDPSNLDEPDEDKKPCYHAVSYVWDNSQPSHPLVLNGKQIYLRKNVFDILHDRSSYFNDSWIWIDSLCINQESGSSEKEKQIQKMRQIYEQAKGVHVYLVNSPTSSLAIYFLIGLQAWRTSDSEKFLSPNASMLQVFQHAVQDWGAFNAEKFSRHMINLQVSRLTNKWTSKQLDAFAEMMNNKWFSRFWIIQELVTAQKVWVHYGNYYVPWSALKKIVALDNSIGFCQSPAPELNRRSVEPSGWISLMWLDHWRNEFQKHKKIALLDVLVTFVSSMATVDKDRVFALLGFTDDSDGLRDLIDYSKPKQEILMRLAQHFLQKKELLRTLSFAGLAMAKEPLSSNTLPSWVADWMVRRLPDVIGPLAGPEGYRAGGNINTSRVRLKDSKNQIAITGVYIDEIQDINTVDMARLPETNPTHTEGLQQLLDHFNAVYGLARRWSPTRYQPNSFVDQPTTEAIHRTLLGDMTFTTGGNPKDIGGKSPAKDDCLDFIPRSIATCTAELSDTIGIGTKEDIVQFLNQFTNVRLLCDGTNSTINPFKPSPCASCGGVEPKPQFCAACDTVKVIRRFCVTKNGYFGVIPSEARPGDIVCVFYGASVPFVLRPLAPGALHGAYQLVGECFLHGIMQGQALRLQLKETEFIIE